MPKCLVLSGRIEWNGFRIANLITSLPASVRADFIEWAEGRDRADYERGYQDGRNEEHKFQSGD